MAAHGALRDLVRAREATKKDQLRARHRHGTRPLEERLNDDGTLAGSHLNLSDQPVHTDLLFEREIGQHEIMLP